MSIHFAFYLRNFNFIIQPPKQTTSKLQQTYTNTYLGDCIRVPQPAMTSYSLCVLQDPGVEVSLFRNWRVVTCIWESVKLRCMDFRYIVNIHLKSSLQLQSVVYWHQIHYDVIIDLICVLVFFVSSHKIYRKYSNVLKLCDML